MKEKILSCFSKFLLLPALHLHAGFPAGIQHAGRRQQTWTVITAVTKTTSAVMSNTAQDCHLSWAKTIHPFHLIKKKKKNSKTTTKRSNYQKMHTSSMWSGLATITNFVQNPIQKFTNVNHTENARQTFACVCACISNSERQSSILT